MGSLIFFSPARPLYNIRPQPARTRARGFTLLELLLVLVIAGLTLGLATLNATPSARQALQNEAQRVALLLQLARDEAIVRNLPVAFEVDANGYRFLIRDENTWEAITQDDMLRERAFARAPLTLSIEPAFSEAGQPIRIIFGREPVDKPFALTMSEQDISVVIRADGIGHFEVD